MENISPSVELVKGKGVKPDILFSKTAIRQDLVDKLRGVLTDGVPSTWKPTDSTTAPHRLYTHYLDNPSNPEFYAKVRSGISRHKHTPGGARLRRIFNADLSLVNEMALSSRVKEVVDSSLIQQAARDHGGFHRVEYLEPLAGIIEKKQEPIKIMIYEYRDMVMPTEHELYRLGFFCDQLRSSLDAVGINPMDLLARQLMISPRDKDYNSTLYVLDSERYVRK